MLSPADLNFLALTATLRYATIRSYVAAWSISPDQAYRRTARLLRHDPPLIRKFRQPRVVQHGSFPEVFIVTRRGASVLAAHGYYAPPMLAKNVARRADAVERGEPTQLQHDLLAAEFYAVMRCAVEDAGLSISIPLWSGERVFQLEKSLFPTIGNRWWRLQPDPTLAYTTYVPDLFFEVTHPEGWTEPYVVEIETGRAEKNAARIGWAKTLKLQALKGLYYKKAKKVLFGTKYDRHSCLRALVWCPSEAYETQFRAGAQSVANGTSSMLWLTSQTSLPIGASTSSKASLAGDMAALRVQLSCEIWRWTSDDGAHALPIPAPNQAAHSDGSA